MIFKKNSKIGIWGFGIVGKSATNYFLAQGYHVNVMDKRIPTQQEMDYLNKNNIVWYDQTDQNNFFTSCDIIIPSPGINISPSCYATHSYKWLHELDFFYTAFKKPIIAITGSIGKTSTTHVLGQIFKELSIPVAIGGNIGIPTFDLINQKKDVDYALLEVSSFQLHHCKAFAPKLAIWTNFYPNHLDHHATEEEYFLAKNNILIHQTKDQLSLIPLTLRDKIPSFIDGHKCSYFVTNIPTSNILATFTENEQLYYINNNTIMRYTCGIHTPLMAITPALLELSFIDNILMLTAICDLLHINNKALQNIATTVKIPEHRVEKIASINSIDFYNDSKATTIQSTLAAIKKLQHRPLHLFLGGLSKGVDRNTLVTQLKNQVKHIYCFGKEAQSLHTMCVSNGIPATSCATLNEAVSACTNNIQSNDCVLLSPAGSSYDLYENYEQRGKHFKELVEQYIQFTPIFTSSFAKASEDKSLQSGTPFEETEDRSKLTNAKKKN